MGRVDVPETAVAAVARTPTAGNDTSEAYPAYPRALGLDDLESLHAESDFGHPKGVAPHPLVGAKTTSLGDPLLISFVWDGLPGETCQVEFVVDLVAGDEDRADGAIEQPPAPESAATTTNLAPAAEDPAESNGLPVTAFVAGVVVYLLYRGRANRTDNQ